MKRSGPRYRIEFIYTRHPVPHEVTWYKWQFLRRNQGYRADYKRFIDKFGIWFSLRGFWYDYDRRKKEWAKADEDYFYENIAPTIAQLCEKWQIGNLFPPTWRFSKKQGTRSIGSRVLDPPTTLAAELNWDSEHINDVLEMGFTGTADSACRYGNLLSVEFDLNRPMKDLVKYAAYVLSRAIENYKKELRGMGQGIPNRRRRLQDYDGHLRVWDLKAQGKSPREIAQLVFPTYSKEYAQFRVRDHLKAAKQLISGAYKEIK